MKNQVSIIIPCYNEEKFIKKCLETIVENDYEEDKMEIMVIDGRSSDGTREIVKAFVRKYPFIRLLDNPGKITPIALNIGFVQAKGDIIVIMGAHTVYSKNYLSKLVYWSEKSGADSVGGVCVTQSGTDTLTAQSIVLGMSSTFGVGNSGFRTITGDKSQQYTDTVPYGAYKRAVFEKIGLFNERLERNQDIEFNKRLINAGGKILLVPEITSYLYARSTLRALWQNNYANGLWVIYTAWLTKDLKSLSLRHFVPLLFVTAFMISGLLSLVSGQFDGSTLFSLSSFLFVIIIISYLFASLFFSALLSIKNGSKHFFILPIVFATLHFSYGLGSIWGLLTLKKWTKESQISRMKTFH